MKIVDWKIHYNLSEDKYEKLRWHWHLEYEDDSVITVGVFPSEFEALKDLVQFLTKVRK